MSFLEDLPPELLRRIFEYTLPQDLTFSFEQARPAKDGSPLWTLFAAKGKHARAVITNGLPYGYLDYCEICATVNCIHDDVAKDMHTGLLNVNKDIASEARGTLTRPSPTHSKAGTSKPQPCSFAKTHSSYISAQRRTTPCPSSHH